MKKITIALLILLGLFCLSAKVMVQEAFTEGLVLYLPLNEGEREEAIDASGNGNNGTITACEWIDEGKFKGALKLSANSSINIPGSESWNPDSHFSLKKPIYIMGDARSKTQDEGYSLSSAIQSLESCVLSLVSK